MSAAIDAPAIDEETALKAAEFFFLLRSNEASAAEVQACAHWRAADPRHERAWQNAHRVSQKFDLLPPSLVDSTLRRGPDKSRRQAVKSLAALLVAVPAGWLAWRSQPAREWRADYRNPVGAARKIVLADGTRVYLNSDTAVDIRYDDRQRLVTLIGGEILIETAPDQAVAGRHGRRPFMVETAQGRVRALGTRFIVRQESGLSRVSVFEGRVEIHPVATIGGDGSLAPATRILEAGQLASFSSSHIGLSQALERHADAWVQGRLYASDMRLDDFVAELSRYRPGIVRCEEAVAALRISGVFQLQDTEQVLRSLPNALPVDVLYRTRYWVTLVATQ